MTTERTGHTGQLPSVNPVFFMVKNNRIASS